MKVLAVTLYTLHLTPYIKQGSERSDEGPRLYTLHLTPYTKQGSERSDEGPRLYTLHSTPYTAALPPYCPLLAPYLDRDFIGTS